MRLCFLGLLTFLSLGADRAFAQGADDEALKAAVLAETMAYYNRDLAAWQNGWLRDAHVTRTLIGVGDSATQTGWENVAAMGAKEIKANPAPIRAQVAFENFTSRRDGNMAWVEYYQVTSWADTLGPPSKSRERRVLVRDNGTWKIASQITIPGDSLENQINGLGYRLLGDGKSSEAIEIFKTNVRLYPDSWNTYDSLGEAYAAAGQKELAIQNYEKSVQLNPKSGSGRAALETLKGK